MIIFCRTRRGYKALFPDSLIPRQVLPAKALRDATTSIRKRS